MLLLALLASPPPPTYDPPGDECTFPIYPHINKGRAWHKADTTQLAPKEVTYIDNRSSEPEFKKGNSIFDICLVLFCL